jgi:16S rRNA G966 N2-methylase RsmD
MKSFYDRDIDFLEVIEMGHENFGEEDNATIIRYDIRKRLYFLSKENKKYDFIFADPPYNYFSANFILDLIAEANLTDENSIVVIEHDAKNKIDYDNLPVHWECYRNSKYGKAVFSFFANKKN